MHMGDDYRAAIARARKEDEDSRCRRRKIRSEYQNALVAADARHAEVCFLSDVHFHLARRSAAEESVMFTLRNTAACWSEVCERTITRQLNIEAATRNRRLGDVAHLELAHQREADEQRCIKESDGARWEDLNARCSARQLADRDAVMRAVLEDTVDRTARCLSGLAAHHLDGAGTKLLAAFTVDATLWQRPGAAEDVGVAVREAFQHVFHGSPYAQSSPGFLSLLEFCYGRHRPVSPQAQVLRLCSVPVLALDGPKYSGKTLLANHLKSRYRLLCISDETLVMRALEAAAEADGSNTNEWAAIGRSVRDTLLAGGAVDAECMTELLELQLAELRAAPTPLPYDAVLLEGVLRSAEAYKAAAQRLSTRVTHPHCRVAHRWGLKTAAEASAEAVTGDALPPLLRLPDHLSAEHDAPAKQEPKARPLKKVDLAALPPAELPEVEDTQAAQEAERAFIARAELELSSLPLVLSGVLHIDCAPEEVFRRFAGLRVDRQTGEKYHLTYNPPPPERLPFMVPLGRPDASSVELHETVLHHLESWAATRRWLSQQAEGATFARVYELSGDGPADVIQREALEAVDHIISNFRVCRQLLDEHDASAARLRTLEETAQTQKAAREAERQRLAELYTEKGAPLPPALTPTTKTASNATTAMLSAEAAEIIFDALGTFTEHYEADYGGVWRSATQLVQLFLRYYTSAEAQLASYWKRPDDKQAILHRFQRCFDAVPESMRGQPACKAELHLSLDTLDEALHRCIALRDGEARGLLDTLTSSASFAGGWQMLICQEFARLLQAEVERYGFVMHVFAFFLGAATGEPLSFDDVETEMPVLTGNATERAAQSAGGSADVAPGGKPAKEKRAAAAKKGHKAAEEQSEKTADEHLVELVQGVLNGFTTITDRLKAAVDAQGKAPKRAGGGAGGGNTAAGSGPTAASSIFAVAAAKCYGLMEAERAAAVARVGAVQACGRTLLREAGAHAKKMRSRMEAALLDVMAREATAANSAVYVLRGCVESERRSPVMHLGCVTFAVLMDRAARSSRAHDSEGDSMSGTSRAPTKATERRSFLTDVPLFAQLTDPELTLHPGLTAVRLLELVQQFRCVAPDYQLSRFDFLLLVEDGDYAEAAAVGIDAAHNVIKTREELFATFDPHRTGFVDWRDVVVHLLFWVTPAAAQTPTSTGSHHGIREIALQDLLNARASLGLGELTEEQFFDLPFFFDRYLDDALLEAYTRILWGTFHNPATQTIAPYVLLGFLCADPQPVRGAQKAFHVLSSPSAAGRVSFDEMDALCHFKATNARLMDQPDPCSKMHLRLLFGAADSRSFEDVCASPMGRKMLNQADLFRRRQFFRRR